jgi:predicted PolB exonuclease-like 3'-5' exonuclease
MNGTDIWSGKIVCISAMDVDNPGDIKTFHEEREEELIVRFLQFFNRNKFQKIVSFNAPHDHLVIISRCLKYQIPAGGFYNAELIDVMQILEGKKYNYNKLASLDQCAQYLLSKGKLKTEDNIPTLYMKGKLSEIILYNRTDVQLTYELWKRITFVLEA